MVGPPATPAFGIPPVGELEGDPGDRIELSFRNESRTGNHNWDTHAPDGLTFVSPPVWTESGGEDQHSCELVSPTYASCPPARSNWDRDNTLTVILQIDPRTPAGPTAGLNTLGREETPFTVVVLPKAPTLDVPETSGSNDRVFELSGTRRTTDTDPAGPSPHSVRVRDSAGRTVCAVPAGTTPTWTCQTEELPPGETTLTATQTSPAGVTSPPSEPVTVRVMDQIEVDAVVGDPTTDRTPAITGTGADPGSTVIVRIAGERYVTTAGEDGGWGVVPDPLSYGRHRVLVHQVVDGVRFDAEPITVTIVPPPVELIAPAEGSRAVGSTVTVTGAAEPRAKVDATVSDRARTVTSEPDGTFQLTFDDLPTGSHDLTVTQTVGGVRSAAVNRRFALQPVPAPPPRPSPSVPPSPPAPPHHDDPPPAAQSPTVEPPPTSATADRPATERARNAPAAERRRAVPPRTREPANLFPDAPSLFPDVPPPQATTTPSTSASQRPPSSRSRSDGRPAGPAGAPAADDGPGQLVPLTLGQAADTMVPGQVALMSGSLGPNNTDRPLSVTVTGRLSRGALYRAVSVAGGDCEVLTLTFRCSVTLQPGRTAAVTIRVLPDALKAPARIVQQIAVSTDGARSNAMTSVVRLDGGKSSDTERLAGQISDFPGSMVVTLAMLLFAIAATATRRRRQGIRQERNR